MVAPSYATGNVLVIDEETIDNGISTIDEAAASHGVDPDYLINDDMPTESGNPLLRWSTLFPGDIVLLPGGEVEDEGLFRLPEHIAYEDGRTTNLTDEEWHAAFVAGTLDQDLLDKVLDVEPLRNPELAGLLGGCYTGIVHDSDISMNYDPLNGSLKGARYGKLLFNVLAVQVPGSIPESQSSKSLFDLWLEILAPSSQLTVTKTGTGSGTVTSDPPGIDCGPDCSEDYDTCSAVNLTATPDEGSIFVGWSGDPDCLDGEVTMGGSKTCTAQFDEVVPETFDLNVTRSGAGSGTVTSGSAGIDCGADCAETYVSGSVVTLTATPDAGSVFAAWSGAADCSDGVVTMDAAKSCDAQFDLELFTLTVSALGDGSGAVTSAPAGINYPSDPMEDYTSGTVVTLTAAPASGSTFGGWSGSCSGAGAVTMVTMDSAKSCIAQFDLEQTASCPCLDTSGWTTGTSLAWNQFANGIIPATGCMTPPAGGASLSGSMGTFAIATPDLSLLGGSGPGCAALGPGDAMPAFKSVTDPDELAACVAALLDVVGGSC